MKNYQPPARTALPAELLVPGAAPALDVNISAALASVDVMHHGMHDMSGEMMEMSGMMDKGDMNPDAMKKMSEQTKQMGNMMENMSGMMGKGAMMDADQHKQMDQMRKNMPASPGMK